ncbi:hypothetical protein BJ684DRAFT_17342 [Piptocephalis cylindrospora]|uniref:Uncharacterized protein n=1 Tax=Piptocephalis cylindrospora TaxID=1907219 RepID=A0A4P9Y0F9_9FUNG|nr:hypothetical protein BJ684DRAFT_17342 [Piptocephalis cylindrospora]|eukprot:RKP12144.1 hypothetical protein BJ684DRAFT_17342 [Piptocephalis cylindrospora]
MPVMVIKSNIGGRANGPPLPSTLNKLDRQLNLSSSLPRTEMNTPTKPPSLLEEDISYCFPSLEHRDTEPDKRGKYVDGQEGSTHGGELEGRAWGMIKRDGFKLLDGEEMYRVSISYGLVYYEKKIPASCSIDHKMIIEQFETALLAGQDAKYERASLSPDIAAGNVEGQCFT